MARSDGVEEEPRAVALRIVGRHDQGPLPAIDHDKGRALGGCRLAAAAGSGKVGGHPGELSGTEIAAARQVLPPLPAGRAEFAGEIEALDMVGIFATLAAVMLGNQRRQSDRGALAFGPPITNRHDVPSRKGGVEPCRAAFLSTLPKVSEMGDGFPLQRSLAAGVEPGDQPRTQEPGRTDAPGPAPPDNQLKPARATLG